MKKLISIMLLSVFVFGIFTVNANALSISSAHPEDNTGSYLIRIKDATETTKVKVVFEDKTYTYNLEEGDNYIPLQFGNGEYQFTIFENVKANIFKKVGFKKVDISNNSNPFLSNNIIVNNVNAQETIKKVSKLITKDMSDEEKISTIYNFVVESLSYDFVKDQYEINTNIDETFVSGTGSSYDYALSTVVLLRHFNVPAKLMIGNHKDCEAPTAWVEVLFKDRYKVLDPVYERPEIFQSSKNYEVEIFY